MSLTPLALPSLFRDRVASVCVAPTRCHLWMVVAIREVWVVYVYACRHFYTHRTQTVVSLQENFLALARHHGSSDLHSTTQCNKPVMPTHVMSKPTKPAGYIRRATAIMESIGHAPFRNTMLPGGSSSSASQTNSMISNSQAVFWSQGIAILVTVLCYRLVTTRRLLSVWSHGRHHAAILGPQALG